MPKFKNKNNSNIVNAIQNDGPWSNDVRWATVRDWLIELNRPFGFSFLTAPPINTNDRQHGELNVKTKDEWKIAKVGDWIIKDQKGNFDVFHNDSFQEEFENIRGKRKIMTLKEFRELTKDLPDNARIIILSEGAWVSIASVKTFTEGLLFVDQSEVPESMKCSVELRIEPLKI